MTQLSLVGEVVPDREGEFHRAVLRHLTQALAEVAPKGCSVEVIVGRGSEAPDLSNPRLSVRYASPNSTMLPTLWRAGMVGSLSGLIIHAPTPLAPLRVSVEEDGSQSTVAIPHLLPFTHPERYRSGQARVLRGLSRRAARLADLVITPNFATAEALSDLVGLSVPTRVLQLPPLPELVVGDSEADRAAAATRRATWSLPDRYVVTTAGVDESDRLEWVLDAVADGALPHLVVLDLSDALGDTEATEAPLEQRLAELTDQVTVIAPDALEDAGAVLAGAELLLMPQAVVGYPPEAAAAIANGVPVVHAHLAEVDEIVLDAGVVAEDAAAFAQTAGELLADDERRGRLRVLARDRAAFFSWRSYAWELWEAHAEL